MSSISYINWGAMSDKAIMEKLGIALKKHRMEKGMTQSEVADEAGISRSTLSLLERGETVTISTLVRILRVLDQLQILSSFIPEEPFSPMQIALQERKERYRVRKKKGDANDDEYRSEW